MSRRGIDSPYAWFRLGVSMLLATIGGVGMWSVVVVLPTVQRDFGVDRGEASLPFTLTMIGFGVGGAIMGRIADKVGIVAPITAGAVALGCGYMLASLAGDITGFALVYGVLIGLAGTATTFAPLMADISHWFEKRRGIAVALCASGNYIGGAIWPPVIEHFVGTLGWRETHLWIGGFCLVTMVPLALLLRGGGPVHAPGAATAGGPRLGLMGLSPRAMMVLLCLAGVSCCVAMSMPQVHIVAYCSDLGYGVARGAQMLSLMLGFGIVSRVASGLLADKVGGMWTLLIGSAAQMTALLFYMTTDALVPLYLISALFGLFQGGIVPSYALVIRDCYPAREAGTRVGLVMMMTILGMALGGWMSGVIFDWTGSYQAAFANGVLWNALNTAIALFLLLRRRRIEAVRPADVARPFTPS
jgi:MFS family permease